MIAQDHKLASRSTIITAFTRISARMNSDTTEMLPTAESKAPGAGVVSTSVVGAERGTLSAASPVGAARGGAFWAMAGSVGVKVIANANADTVKNVARPLVIFMCATSIPARGIPHPIMPGSRKNAHGKLAIIWPLIVNYLFRKGKAVVCRGFPRECGAVCLLMS